MKAIFPLSYPRKGQNTTIALAPLNCLLKICGNGVVFKHICQKAGCENIKHEGNIIIYGANEYNPFGPVFIHLLHVQQIKPYLVKAIWSDKDCFHSYLENILKEL